MSPQEHSLHLSPYPAAPPLSRPFIEAVHARGRSVLVSGSAGPSVLRPEHGAPGPVELARHASTPEARAEAERRAREELARANANLEAILTGRAFPTPAEEPRREETAEDPVEAHGQALATSEGTAEPPEAAHAATDAPSEEDAVAGPEPEAEPDEPGRAGRRRR